MNGYQCQKCELVFFANEAHRDQILVNGHAETVACCARNDCRSIRVDPCTICPTCQVARTAAGYDECEPCDARTELKRLAALALDRRQRDRRTLIDIATPMGFERRTA